MGSISKLVLPIIFVFFHINPAFAEIDDLRKYISPVIKGETLYISGIIDSHIYDFFSFNIDAIQKVKRVSLNSWGGDHDWSLEIARRIGEEGLDTVIEKDSVCASACVYLFGSGVNRVMHSLTWLGVHGARLGQGRIVQFAGVCFEMIDDEPLFDQSKTGCASIVEKFYKLSLKATTDAFKQLELNGVVEEFTTDYLNSEDDPLWFLQGNFLKKKDWVIKAKEALKYNLATGVY